jgi:uncharacterized NAD(P)/FAD-binding protein YdhS
MNPFTGRHAIIIGGGASGVMLAYQLLHHPASDFRVTLIEMRPDIGRGLAYHTNNPEHRLNVCAADMSALPNQPDHFWKWLSARHADLLLSPDPYCFVPRRIYGDYLAGLIEPIRADGNESRRLAVVQGECVEISEGKTSVAVALASSARYVGDIAILATGNETTVPKSAYKTDPWRSPRSASVDRTATILILGTGLTMVDYVLSLLMNGHQGPILAMSRRGLMPQVHRRVDTVHLEEADIPFGASAYRLLRWLRQRTAAHVAGGGDWRGMIDAIRPFTQRLWQELPLNSKRRFLEHARAWWDMHRHRMAPEIGVRIAEALAADRLRLMAGKVTSIEPNADGMLVRYRRRGQPEIVSIKAGAIVDCTGIVKDPRTSANPVVRSLFDQGLARADPLHISIETEMNCAIVDRDGSPSRRLFAVGPVTRATFWEIVAIPDIRNQCARLATRLISHDNAAIPPADDIALHLKREYPDVDIVR